MTVRINHSEFESIVGEILKAALNAKLTKHDGRTRQPLAPDLEFEFAGESWSAEVKYYRTARAHMPLLRDAAEQACHLAIRAQAEKVMLVVSSELAAEQKAWLESTYPVLVVDRPMLRSWALSGKSGEAERLDALLDGDSTESLEHPERTSESFDIAAFLARAKALATVTEIPFKERKARPVGEELAEDLAKLPKGKESWSQYEELCTRILKHLFDMDLKGWHRQKRSDDGLNRYDLVCRVSPSREFWKFVAQAVGSSYVVFEFKNYKEPISQGQVLSTEKYLMERALRKVAVILSRSGEDSNALKTRQGAMREAGKLLVVLDDEKVKQLLFSRDRAGDPSDLLFNWVDEFLMELPR